MTHDQVKALTASALRSIIASTNPDGIYANEVAWARQELDRRGVDYRDCLAAQ